MSILNEPSDGTISVLVALRNTLRAYGPMSQERLLELCAPETVVADKKARAMLTRWMQLGAFREESRRIVLAAELAGDATDNLRELRGAVLRIILHKRNNPAVTPTEATDDDLTLASDFTRAMAWALLQDPYDFPTKYSEFEARRMAGTLREPSVTVFKTSNRWAGFLRWATFLGLAVNMPHGLLLNPAFAIKHILHEVLAAGASIPLKHFLAGIAEVLPVFPGGAYSEAIVRQLPAGTPGYGEHEVPPAMALALFTLQEARVLTLASRSDAAAMTFRGWNGRRCGDYSDVVRGEA